VTDRTLAEMKATHDRLVALTAIQKVLKGLTDEARGQVLDVLTAAGTRNMDCTAADGTELGTTSRTKGKRTVAVTDHRALLAWVREHHPLWIEEAIAAAPWARLKKELLARDAPCTDTGDVIPGLAIVDGEPGVSVRVTRDAEARMADIINGMLPELTAEPWRPAQEVINETLDPTGDGWPFPPDSELVDELHPDDRPLVGDPGPEYGPNGDL
jgi:hypothetical protein